MHDFANNPAKKFGAAITEYGVLDVVEKNHPPGGMTANSISLRSFNREYPLPDDLAALDRGKVPAHMANTPYSTIAADSEKYCETPYGATAYDRYVVARSALNDAYTKELLDADQFRYRQLNPNSKEAMLFQRGDIYIEEKLGMGGLTPQQRSAKFFISVKNGTCPDVPVERVRVGAKGLANRGFADLNYQNYQKIPKAPVQKIGKDTFTIPESAFK